MSEQSDEAQYDLFVAVAAGTGTVWSLWQGGWASLEGEAEQQGLPLWASPDQAENWRQANAQDWEVMPLDMDWLLEDILPNVSNEGGYVILFGPDDGGLWVQPGPLLSDIRDQLNDND